MISYAGIGSRNITEVEEARIISIANILQLKGLTLYSGNANGSDIAFQKGSNGKCVIMLPWKGFNINEYDYNKNAIDHIIVNPRNKEQHKEAYESVSKFHPKPESLTQASESFMARNFYQVNGFGKYPKVSIVICCADPVNKKGNVKGGTGQAVRIALKWGIPVINLRDEGWFEKIKTYLNSLALEKKLFI